MRLAHIAFALLLAGCSSASTSPPIHEPVITLSGEITRADHQTYREISFTVPPGTQQIDIDFTYDKTNRTVIDLGLRDPQGQRGWSGGNKSRIHIGEYVASPSYRRAKIQPGEWKLVLGIPNIREGQTSHYEATVAFSREPDSQNDTRIAALGDAPPTAAGWFRGDFHMHTGHSDGSCNVEGERGPCPVSETLTAAHDAGLDFAVVTDHNTISQLDDIRMVQGQYPRTLLIPGMEITTFYGHANAIGVTDFVDFQLGSPRLPRLDRLFEEVGQQGAILSINHPALPSGEVCMGCGWTAKDTDWGRVAAIEAVNGSTLRTGGAEGPASGIRFWDNLLKQGYRLTAIGGSDNHDATDRTGEKQPPIGKPTTVVYASELSTKGIIAGVKSGRVFIDLTGDPGATLDMIARVKGQEVYMGGDLRLHTGEAADLDVTSADLGSKISIEVINHNVRVRKLPSASAPNPHYLIELEDGALSGWVRVNVRDPSGKLLMIGNPIYLRPA